MTTEPLKQLRVGKKKNKHKYMLRDHVTMRRKASEVWLDVIRGNIFQWGRNMYESEDNDEFKVSS